MSIPRWILVDGAMAHDDVVVDRMYQSAKEIDTISSRMEFGYIVRNINPSRAHKIVPLAWLPKKSQHGMQVVDSKDHNLVQFNSYVCAEISRYRAEILLNKVDFFLGDYFNGESTRLDPIFLQSVIRPPQFKSRVIKERDEAIVRIEKVMNKWLARASAELVADLLRGGNDIPGIEGDDRVAYLSGSNVAREEFLARSNIPVNEFLQIAKARAPTPSSKYRRFVLSTAIFNITEFTQFVMKHSSRFIPYVLLKEPITYHGKYGVGAEFLVHNIPAPSTSTSGKSRILKWIGERIRNIIQFTIGWYPLEARFMLQRSSASCHFRVDLPKGVLFRYYWPLKPKVRFLPTEVFHKNMEVNKWEGRETSTFHFYRNKQQLRDYAQWLSSNHYQADNLHIRMIARELRTPRLLSYLLFALTIAFVYNFHQHDPPPFALLAAPVAIALSLALFAYDKPILMPVMARRIFWSFAIITVGIFWDLQPYINWLWEWISSKFFELVISVPRAFIWMI